MRKFVKTSGQVDYETYCNAANVSPVWDNLAETSRKIWERHATSLPTPIPPLEQDVPETDGELMMQVAEKFRETVIFTSIADEDEFAAEFLRLRAERDGTKEPLEVTPEMVREWHINSTSAAGFVTWKDVAAKINAHRGVRPVPKVTAKMVREMLPISSYQDAADYLNAKLAEAK